VRKVGFHALGVGDSPVDMIDHRQDRVEAALTSVLGEPELPHAADVKFETALVLWPQPNPRIVHEQAQDDVAGTWRHDPRLRAVQTKPRALKSLPCPAHDGGGSAPNLYRQPVNLTLPHEQAFA